MVVWETMFGSQNETMLRWWQSRVELIQTPIWTGIEQTMTEKWKHCMSSKDEWRWMVIQTKEVRLVDDKQLMKYIPIVRHYIAHFLVHAFFEGLMMAFLSACSSFLYCHELWWLLLSLDISISGGRLVHGASIWVFPPWWVVALVFRGLHVGAEFWMPPTLLLACEVTGWGKMLGVGLRASWLLVGAGLWVSGLLPECEVGMEGGLSSQGIFEIALSASVLPCCEVFNDCICLVSSQPSNDFLRVKMERCFGTCQDHEVPGNAINVDSFI